MLKCDNSTVENSTWLSTSCILTLNSILNLFPSKRKFLKKKEKVNLTSSSYKTPDFF